MVRLIYMHLPYLLLQPTLHVCHAFFEAHIECLEAGDGDVARSPQPVSNQADHVIAVEPQCFNETLGRLVHQIFAVNQY